MSDHQIVLSEWEQELAALIQSFQSGVNVETLEEDRCIESVLRVAQSLRQRKLGRRTVYRWSLASDCQYDVSDPNTVTYSEQLAPLFRRLDDFVKHKTDNSDGEPIHAEGILLLCDVEPVLRREASVVRKLRESLETLKKEGARKTIIIVNKSFDIPDELRTGLTHLPFKLPTVEDIRVMTKSFVDRFRKTLGSNPEINITLPEEGPISEGLFRAFATACSGLTLSECRHLLGLTLAKHYAFDDRSVALAMDQKGKRLLRDKSLTMMTPRRGFSDVGGLENVKAWADLVTPMLGRIDDARAYGMSIPSGMLLVGTPGCGKSLACEALAHEWHLPQVNLDIGACYGSLVGQSEGNIRKMIAITEALRPCMVRIDEIEKGLGGDSLDGGTSNRVKQTLLTWLQEKPDDVFVVATANDLTKLEAMPEILRQGRIDATFFVDLPDYTARKEIFRIHLRLSGHTVDAETITEAARLTRGYSGAEIEGVVQLALRSAFAEDEVPDNPSWEHIQAGIRDTQPLSATMVESIARMRDWCRQGRAKAAGRTLEDDTGDELERVKKRNPYPDDADKILSNLS